MYKVVISYLLLILLSGCSGFVSQKSGQHSVSSSLTSFLYPDKNTKTVQTTEVPTLKLPVKIGLAFLPSNNWRGKNFDESNKYKLLNKVKAAFGEHRFIDSITVIPSTYLRYRDYKGVNGFDTLEQVARLHDVDVMALVSYDQLTQSHHNNASLLYWTIVGMYVIPGNENTIQTFVDTAVFDVKSRKMLMRAPGISKLRKRSTAIGVDSAMTEKSQRGFELAFDDMIKNLNIELTHLRGRVKQGRSVKIQHQQGYTGGGSFGFLMLLLFGIVLFWKRNSNKVNAS